MAEMYQAWAKGHPPPGYPANPTFIPPLAQSQEPPTMNSSLAFPLYQQCYDTTSHTSQAPSPKQVSYPPSPVTPVFVAPLPAALHRSSNEPLFQTHDNQYYPTEPTFKVPEPYTYTSHFDLSAETKKPSKNLEQEKMFRKFKSLEQSFRDMQGLGGHVSVSYKDLYIFLYVQLPAGFKMLKFDLYGGHGDPVAHLRGFCSIMRGAGGKDDLIMAYFSQSLSDSVLEWYTRQDHGRWYTWDDLAQAFACHFQYNLEIIPDRLSLTKLEKKHSESFREYGFRWREQAARVDPPMKESEMVDYFMQALEPAYFSHLVSDVGKSFNKVVKIGAMVEEGLKSNKIMSYSAIKATTQAIQNVIQELIDTNRIEVQAPEAPNINENLLPAHPETNMIEIVHRGGEPKKPSQIVMMIRSSEVRLVEKPTSEKLVIRLEPSAVAKKGTLSNVAVKQERAKVVMPGVVNKPVVIVEGAHTDAVIIKPITQLPIVNNKAITWNYERVTVTYKGKEVKEKVYETHGLTRSGRCFAPEELRKAKTSKENPLRKTPVQISLLSLLTYSNEHRRALMKILNEAHVPYKISVNHLEKIANKIFEVNRVTFSDDELLVEGTKHNRALYLTVKYEDSMVTRVLVDNGSSANIFPLSTLNKLKVDDERIHKNSICVRGFDSGGKDSVGNIVLKLTIGPVEFTMEFQVLDVAISYNLLLGRPWIHAAKVVLSTLHQMVKFEWDRQEIVVHNEDNLLDTKKRPATTVPSSVVGPNKEFLERFEKLFDEVNMVEAGEGSSKADVQFVGPSAKINNWEATLLPTRKKFSSFYVGFNDMHEESSAQS
ncbi:uncharacterized protein [Nicotiana sylvestris]|uniref:uncharacterized protein n=1 Tax=Nicotiana sylvestris TaxID=4096 RepID=UPI00388C4041